MLPWILPPQRDNVLVYVCNLRHNIRYAPYIETTTSLYLPNEPPGIQVASSFIFVLSFDDLLRTKYKIEERQERVEIQIMAKSTLYRGQLL